ncbi:MAG: hypothetical protein Q3M24_21560 [Candidatus Electrothrix aestuarii]|uniref:Secreted protein n=1 Tax=Candidatus Electrothrix aestuarii TaxID=3062594 RepID=A0AAU8LVC2_9BACT|nr:hypothetical protein [Candidatus Electrothrix aestuarii]
MLKKVIMTSAVLTISLALATPLLAGSGGTIVEAGAPLPIDGGGGGTSGGDVGNGIIVGVRSGDIIKEDYVQRNGNGISGGNPSVLQGFMNVGNGISGGTPVLAGAITVISGGGQ